MRENSADIPSNRLLELVSLLAVSLRAVESPQKAETLVLQYLAAMFPGAHCDYLECDDELHYVRLKASSTGAILQQLKAATNIPVSVFKGINPSEPPILYVHDSASTTSNQTSASAIAPAGTNRCHGFLLVTHDERSLRDPQAIPAISLVSSLFASTIERLNSFGLQRDALCKLLGTLEEFTKETNLFLLLGQRLAAVAEQLNSKAATLWSYIPEQDILLYAAGYDGSRPSLAPRQPEHAFIEIAHMRGAWQTLSTTSRPLVFTRATNDQELPAGLRDQLRGGEQLLVIPMLAGMYIAGLLTFTDPDIDLEMASTCFDLICQADEFGMGIQLHRLTRQSSEVALLKERNRMAREIHDTLAQGFTGIIMWLEAARLNLPDNPKTVLEHLQRAKAVARESLTEARGSLWALRPSILQEYDLPQAIPQLADRLTRDAGHDVCFALHGSPREIPARCEEALLRIAQEAIGNVLRHANADMIRIELEYLKRSVRLKITDNGCGLTAHDSRDNSGFGMTSMEERAEQVGGTFTISNKPEGGVDVKVEIPV